MPLHQAIVNNSIFCVKLLIDKNSVNVKGWKDYTPLIYACSFARFNQEIIEILLDHGADINAQSEEGETALHFAARNGHVELFKLLEMNGADLNIYNNKKERAVHLLFSK